MKEGVRRLPHLGAAFLFVCSWLSEASAQELNRGPYLQSLSEDSVIIVWRTDGATDSVLEYGTSSEFEQVVTDPTRSVDHALRLTGLTPGTVYHYRLRGGGSVISDSYRFRTANPESDSSFNFVSLGDSGSLGSYQRLLADVAQGLAPRLVLQNGHVVNPEGRRERYDPMFFQPYARLLPEVPFWPVLSDHDYFTERGAPYFETFHLPANNPDRTERYYSFNYGNAHFMALDIESDFSPGSAQYLWLANELRYHRRQWNFVHVHGSPYSSSFWGPQERGFRIRDHLAPLFETFGVDVVFCGAKHHYERHFPVSRGEVDIENGVVYLVTAGGGQPITPVFGSDLTAYHESSYHLSHATVTGDQLRIDAVRSDGSVMDSFGLTAREWTGPLFSPPEEDLILHLPFDEAGGDAVLDASGHGQDGYLGAAVGPDASDPVRDHRTTLSGAGSLWFNRTQGPRYVTVPDTRDLFEPGSGFTLMAWTRQTREATWNAVIGAGTYDYALYLSGRTARGYFRTLSPSGTGRSRSTMPANRWGHVALVYDAGTVTLYVNGIQQESTFHGGTFGEIEQLYVGYDGSGVDGFHGWIDEVKVFRRALAPEEIRSSMVNTLQQVEYPADDPPPAPIGPLLPEHLICHLSFDEGTGQTVLDSSGSGNRGTLGTDPAAEAEDPTWTPYGRFGAGGLRFDGVDDRVTVPDLTSDFDLDELWTMMAWVQFDDDAPWQPVVSGGTFEYGLYIDRGAARTYSRNLRPVGTGRTDDILPPGAWHHVALVRERDALILYLNGRRSRVTTVTDGRIAPVDFLLVGHDGYPGDFFRGTIDEVKIYRHPLTRAEVRDEMTSTLGIEHTPSESPPPPPDRTIGRWRFEEGAGQSFADASGNGRDGHLGQSPGADGGDPRWDTARGTNGSTALHFDGADRVATIPDLDDAFDLDESFTLMAWVRYDSTSNWSAVVSGGDYRFALYLTPGGRTRAYFRDLSPPATSFSDRSVPSGTWTHVAVTKDGETVRLYVNGTEAGTSSHRGSIQPVDRFRIGFDGYPGEGFHGSIDGVEVHGRALSAEEIQARMAD